VFKIQYLETKGAPLRLVDVGCYPEAPGRMILVVRTASKLVAQVSHKNFISRNVHLENKVIRFFAPTFFHYHFDLV